MKYNETNAHPSLQAWSQKNRDEQEWVSQYIAHILNTHGINFLAEGPHPEKAGKLVHLCTDFRFSLPDLHTATRLLEALHPTPQYAASRRQPPWPIFCNMKAFSVNTTPVSTDRGNSTGALPSTSPCVACT